MASGTLAPSPYLTVLDGNGNPLPGAKIYTYAAGTTTNIATYSDAALTVANTNPIVADAAGRYTAYLSPGIGYRFDIKTSGDVSVDSVDNILGVPSSASTIDVVGTAGVAISAGQVVYLSTGTGGAPTAGKWYLADADNTYSSTIPIIGVAVDAIALNNTGTIRLAGAVSNPSVEGGGTMTIGNTYYISTTAGSITTTAPANAKVVGLAQSSTVLVVSYQSTSSVGDLSVSGTLGVTGAATLSSTLAVTGNATLGGTLGLTGLLTLTAGQIAFPATQNASSNANTLDDYEEGTYTPTWTGTGTPAIGNGTLTGRYTKIGRLVNATLYLVGGSTTTWGTAGAVWRFGLPFACANDVVQPIGIGIAKDASVSYFYTIPVAVDLTSLSTVRGYNANPAGEAGTITSSAPFTWATSDTLSFTITYFTD